MVETFLVKESTELIHDPEKLQEWMDKCAELGLNKQLELAEPNKSPIPFEAMNEIQKRVFETICPARRNYKEYSKTAIPLEVLSLIALSEKEGYFDKIEIWADDEEPDPLAVGIVKTGQWDNTKYLIARWGHEAMAFELLTQKAIMRYKKRLEISLKKKISEAEVNLKNIDNNVNAYFQVQAEGYSIGADNLIF